MQNTLYSLHNIVILKIFLCLLEAKSEDIILFNKGLLNFNNLLLHKEKYSKDI